MPRDPKKKNRVSKFRWRRHLLFLMSLLIPMTCLTLGFSGWNIGENQASVNVSVYVGDVTTYKASLEITATLTSGDIYFDAETGDSDGTVQKKDGDATEENLDIAFNGTVNRTEMAEWTSIKASLTVSGSNSSGTSYQSIYEDLVDDGYIVRPTFDALPNDGTNGTSNSTWTSKGSSLWRYSVTSSFSYGTIFGNTNPSSFFDSSIDNGTKKGSEYTTAEIQAMLDRLHELDGAKYVITLRVLTPNNGSTITLNSNSGTFATTNSTSDISYEDLLQGDLIYFPKVYKANYAAKYYYLSGTTGHTSSESYRFYPGKTYDFSIILTAYSKSQGDDLTLTVYYSSTASTLTVSSSSGSEYLTVSYTVTWLSSNSGTTTGSKVVSDNSSWTQVLNIGDVVSFSMSGASNIKNYNVYGFEGVEDGTSYKKSAYFEVATSSPRIEIVPYGQISIPVEFTFDTAGTSQVSGQNLTDKAGFNLVTSSNSSTYLYGTSSVAVAESGSFSLSNYHGVNSLVVKDLSGNVIESTDGSYTASEDMKIYVNVAPAIEVKWSITSSEASSSGTTGPSFGITYNNAVGQGSTSVSQDYSDETGNNSGTLTISTMDTINVTSSNATVTVTYTNSGTTISSYNGESFQQGITISATGSYKASSESCLLPGTLITMADGSKKPVEEIVAGDYVLAFNHETGNIEPSMVLFNDAEEEAMTEVLYLGFSGKEVGVIYEHGFFDRTLNEYVYITPDNYEDYLGHEFAYMDESGNMASRLLSSAYVVEEYTACYSPVTYSTLNYFTEDMLSIPGATEGFCNYFEYDPDTLAYDAEQKAADIEAYGLLTYADFAELGLPEDIFHAFNGQYLAVSMGKGLISWEDIAALVQRYGKYF